MGNGGMWWRTNRYDREREKGRQEVWLINSEGEFSVAGLLQHVGDPSQCPGLQLQHFLSHLSISLPPHHHHWKHLWIPLIDVCCRAVNSLSTLHCHHYCTPSNETLINLTFNFYLSSSDDPSASMRAKIAFCCTVFLGEQGSHRT